MRKPAEVVPRIRRRPHLPPRNRSSASIGSRYRASRRLNYRTPKQTGRNRRRKIVCGLLKRRLRSRTTLRRSAGRSLTTLPQPPLTSSRLITERRRRHSFSWLIRKITCLMLCEGPCPLFTTEVPVPPRFSLTWDLDRGKRS